MRGARGLAVLLVSVPPGVACTAFDIYKGADDAGTTRAALSRDGAARDAHTGSETDASDGATVACSDPWEQTDAPCSSRQLFGIATGVGAVTLLHVARAFDGGIAVLYGLTSAGGVALTLTIVDPVTHVVRQSNAIATAPSFDSAALSYDDQGTLSVAYHATAGAPVVYMAFAAGLDAGTSGVVVADASASLLALSTIPSSAVDGAAPGPLGFVTGTVGLAWYPAPREPNDFSMSYLHLFALQATTWNDVEQYGYTEVRSDLGLQPNYQGGVVASGVAYSVDPMVPYEACTWQMAGRVSQCGPASELFGVSLAVGPRAAYLAYTYPDPTTGETTLDVATDTDGSYTFPLLSTVATLGAAVSEGQAEPRGGLSGGTLALAVAYPTENLTDHVDFFTWDVATHAVTSERVTTTTPNGAATPPLDLVVDRSGVPTLAFADPGAGAIYLARAILPSSTATSMESP